MPTKMPINAVAISCSEDTLSILRKFEEENTFIIKLLNTTAGIEEGVVLINSLRPDVVFLDIVLHVDFFELYSKLEFNPPKLIFIDSNAAASLQAFQYNAVDFILKPIGFNALILSMYKAIKQIEMERIYQEYKIHDSHSGSAASLSNQNMNYVAISSSDKIELIQMKEIIYCQADGKYTNFFLRNGKKIMSSRNLGEYVSLLDSTNFFRIHHSYIVNLRYISKIIKKDGYLCELVNNVVLPIAKRRQDDFNKFIKLKE